MSNAVVPPPLPSVTVAVQSAWLSRINWTQVVSLVAMLFTMYGVSLPPDVQNAMLAAITAISTVVTFVLRTWFTTTVTPSSLGK